MAKVAFVGLGVMGYPMAGHLKNKGGHEVTVYNRTAAKAEKWVAQYGGKSAPTPKAAAQGQDFVMACVGNDNDLREVMLGENGIFAGVAQGRHRGRSHHRLGRDRARALRRSKEARLRLHRRAGLGRPGRRREWRAHGDVRRRRSAVRQSGKGDRRLRARLQSHRAPPAPASSPRWSTRSASPALVQGLAEGLHFAQKAGLDIEKLIATISKGAAQSWQMENRYKTMVAGKFDFGFAVDWMRKDLDICLDEARRNGAHLPVSALVDQFYSQVQKMGGRRWDTSSLIALLQR